MSGKGPVHTIEEGLEKFGIDPGYVFFPIGIVVIGIVLWKLDIAFGRIFGFIAITSPLWLPFVLFHLFFENWLLYVRKKFDLEQGRVSLEIRLPQDVYKSPLAMELVLAQMYQTASPDNLFQTYLDGKKPPMFGLEIISEGGRVRFIINTPQKKFKNLIEAQLYAQYPGIEVTELPIDYTAGVPWDPERFAYFSIHFGLKKADALPIKTYIDFGLDKDPKEEYKIDPITPVLELLGSIGPKERIWVQVLITANREENFEVGYLSAKPDWKEDVRKEINKLAQRDKESKAKLGDTEFDLGAKITPGERDTIAAMERTLGKYAFNTAIRAMYIAEKDAFMPGERIGAIISMWRSFDDLNRNQIGFRWRTDYNWNMWQDPTGHKREHQKHRELEEYKKREYTPQNPAGTPKVMTTEELATVFHLPGKVALTPTLGRIPSTRAEAPANLPRASS